MYIQGTDGGSSKNQGRGGLLCFSDEDSAALTSASGELGPGRERELLQDAKLRVHSVDCISFSRMWVESAKDFSLLMKASVLSHSFWILRLGFPCTQKLEASFTFLVCPQESSRRRNGKKEERTAEKPET